MKCILTVAGLGTRLLPLTKELPKEMLPIYSKTSKGDITLKPILQVIFESLYQYKIREYCFIVGRTKRSVEDHFTPDNDLIKHLQKEKKKELALDLKNYFSKLEKSHIVFTYQPKPIGFGDAIQRGKKFVNNEYFLLHAGDDIVISKNNNHLQRLESNFKKYDAVFDESAKYALKIKNTIKEIGIDGNTILIFFSDHGTGIGERFGERNYGSFTYEETIRTFFLFSGKNVIPDRCSDCLRETIDIFPTILDLADINAQLERPGVSFSDYLVDGNTELKEKQFTFSETGALHGPYPSPKEPNVFCIKNSKEKLIYYQTPQKWEYFDLDKDPKELENKFDENDTKIIELKERLTNWMNRN